MFQHKKFNIFYYAIGLCSYVPMENHLLLFSHLVVSSSFADLGTVARQGPLSMEFPRQEYWRGWPFPSPGGLPDQGVKPGSPVLQADSFQSEPSIIQINLI